MDRLERMDRRARYAVGGTLAFVGVLLLVLGWYLISGEAIAAKQLPYLASASLPGAVLVVCGFLFAVTGPTVRDAEAARRIAELHALLTEAVTEPVTEPASEPVTEVSAEAGARPETGEAEKNAEDAAAAEPAEPIEPIEPIEPTERIEPEAADENPGGPGGTGSPGLSGPVGPVGA